MTAVRFPPIVDGEGTVYPTTLQISLVDADHNPVLGIVGAGLTTEYQQAAVTTTTTVDLVPQAQIALLGGGATWYRVKLLVTAGRRLSQTWYVQVPESPPLVELTDLLAAQTIDPADLLVETLAPYLEARDEAEAAAATAAGYAADTAADALATAADRVQTGADALAAAGSAQTAASQAQTATTQAQAATTQAGLAAQRANAAAGSAQDAENSAGVATGQATAAQTWAGQAATSAQNAADSADEAAGSAHTAAGQAQTATTQAGLAADSAAAAAGSAQTAAAQAQTAITQAGLAADSAQGAETQAGLAAGYADTASTQAGLAAGSAQTATTQAGLAAGSAQTATTQAGLAADSADAAAASYDSFDDRYLGAKASDPATDNDGNALVTGALYWNTTDEVLKVWDGSAWLGAADTLATEQEARILADTQLQDHVSYALDLGVQAVRGLTDAVATVQVIAAGLNAALAGYDGTLDTGSIAHTQVLDLIGQVARAVAGGYVYLAAGSAGEPALSPLGDRDTGLFFPAANVLALATAGVERARLDDTGQLGLGTNAPSCALDVASNKWRLRTAKTPSAANDSGNAGDWCWDANYIYVCVATNTWKRATLATW